MTKRPANLIGATAAAFRISKELGFPHPKEVDLRDLAMFRNVLVREGPLSGSEGRLIRKKGRGIIHVREHLKPEGRKRFTIAHELGHWELHANQSQFLCDTDDMRDYGRSPLEMEANHFAAELLMPTSHFREACASLDPCIATIKTLAEEFQTTLTSTAIRFADMSRHKVVIVWHKDDKVRWSYSDPKKQLPFVAAGRPPPAFSSATLPGPDVAEGMDHYDEADWFPQLLWGKDDIEEETLRMNVLNAGLTILCFP